MPTAHTAIIAAAFRYTQASTIHQAMVDEAAPTGTRFFGDRPTHVDQDGTEWVYVEASSRPERAQAFAALTEHFPEARFAVVGEVVPVDEIDGRTVVWRDGGRAMVRTQERGVLLDGLERVVVEGDEL